MKYILLIFITILLSNCTVITPEMGTESVLMDKPVFFGKGGMRKESVKPGRIFTYFTVSEYNYSTQPTTRKEHYEDVATRKGTPVDLDMYLTYKLIEGKSPTLHSKYGENWYKKYAVGQIRDIGRQEIRKHEIDALRTDNTVTDSIQNSAKQRIQAFFDKGGLPIKLIKISLSKANPPPKLAEEMDATAAQVQRERTELARAKAEMARAESEKQAAISDKAYSKQFNMTTQQFLQNKFLDIIKNKTNVNIVTGGTIPTVKIK